ncbi:hypothetical protein [uncultured Clostridium sp.]|jgi:hypothetical protein|uniref:hypothetical protein n=1 Tax=uncultured Clostridium sp. TaxID=59620 RepID=UPI00260FD724|nr:hypothetical protein [uncultured Clostridium sp.]
MDTLDKRKKLIDEVISLIREFEGISVDIRESRIEELRIDDEYTQISYELEDEKLIFPLTKISHIYEIEFEGLGELAPTFPELVLGIKQNIEANFEQMNKADFIHFVGNIYYADLRCRQIYNRLKEIEKEAQAI